VCVCVCVCVSVYVCMQDTELVCGDIRLFCGDIGLFWWLSYIWPTRWSERKPPRKIQGSFAEIQDSFAEMYGSFGGSVDEKYGCFAE